MKKSYSKPTIEFVDFTLSSSIASTCKWQADFAQNTCDPVIEDNGWTIYNEAFACDYQVDQNPDVCYHVPTADSSLFNS